MGTEFLHKLPLLMLLILLFTLFSVLTTTSTAQDFKCGAAGSQAKCQALVGYLPPNATAISAVQSLFNVRNLRSILGANDLPLTTSRNFIVPALRPIKIPIPCLCNNGTGVSNKKPVYTVKKDDGLDFIARTIFGGLLTYPKIAAANNIANVNLIKIGQNLTIPLPCSCDDVDNQKVVHYAHIVEARSSFESIAERFGTDKETLMNLNGIDDEKKLIEGQVLDVPLKACNSSIRGDSLDSALLVANGTYVFTANSCVKCRCDSANNWTLQCEPSQLRPSNSSWRTCPSMLCEGPDSLSIGNTTSNGCNQNACTYAGYNNLTILTTLKTLSTCSTPSNNALRMGSSWNLLLISIFLVLLHFHLIQ